MPGVDARSQFLTLSDAFEGFSRTTTLFGPLLTGQAHMAQAINRGICGWLYAEGVRRFTLANRPVRQFLAGLPLVCPSSAANRRARRFPEPDGRWVRIGVGFRGGQLPRCGLLRLALTACLQLLQLNGSNLGIYFRRHWVLNRA